MRQGGPVKKVPPQAAKFKKFFLILLLFQLFFENG